MKRKLDPQPIPSDFTLTDSMRQWGKLRGFTRLEERTEWFIDYCLSKAVLYADYTAAWRNSVRGDWAKLNATQSTARKTSEQEWIAAGAERGVYPGRGESMQQFIARVQNARPS